MNTTSIRITLPLVSLLSLATACSPRNEAMDVVSPRDTAADTTTPPADTSVPNPDATAPDATAPDVTAPESDASAPDGAAPDATPADAGPACPASPTVQMIAPGDLTASQTWDCTREYRITGLTFVRAGATLTIRPGTRISALGMGAAIVITRGARIDAQGTRAQPIVFTSANPAGMRRQGDWAGLVLLGAAPINVTGMGTAAGTNNIEGIEATDSRGNYGGSDPSHDCGTVRYARIEFAGQGLSMGNELNGLTTGGCGTGTTIDFVQVHQAADDAFEFFGGTHDARHLIATQQDDDGLDWDFGWTGRAQFVVIQSPATSGESDPRAIEADNNGANNDATPRSSPTIYNLTVVGAGPGVAYTQPAIVLRRGTAGALHNVIVMNQKQGAADVLDNATVALTRATPATLFIRNSIFFNNGAGGMTHFTDLSATAAEGTPALDENAFFRDAPWMNRFDLDVLLPSAANATAPVFAPAATSPAATGGATPPAGFDATATFVGAVRPGATGADDWTTGWTAFPAN